MAHVNQLPRPLLIALVGAVAVAAFMVATRRGGETDTASTSTPVAQAPSGSQSGSQSANGSNPGTRPSGTVPGRLPARVDRALDANKIVVLLFWNQRGSDDRAVKAGVDSISTRGGKVARFTDSINDISRYTRVTGTQTVTQSPALVVVDRDGKAQVATGYLDPQSVDQLVVDALD